MAARLPTPAAFRRMLSSPSLLLQQTPCRTTTLPPRIMTIARRTYSAESEPAPAPLLVKMKVDLKAAMRAKDATRLAVLRSIMSATLNASKTDKPIRTDAQLVALLRKTARASQDAVAGFKAAGRDDLVEKEDAQIKVLEEYAAESGVKTVGEKELGDAVAKAKEMVLAEKLPLNIGTIRNMLTKVGGPLEGKDFDGAELMNVIKAALK